MKTIQLLCLATACYASPLMMINHAPNDAAQDLHFSQMLEESLESTKSTESIESIDSAESTEPTKDIDFAELQEPVSKPRAFIGVELGAAMAQDNIYHQIQSALPLRLQGGLVWFFTKNHGLRLKAHIGYASYALHNRAKLNSANAPINLNNHGELLDSYNVSSSSIYEQVETKINDSHHSTSRNRIDALEYGLHLNYLYNIASLDKTTIGVSLGAGIEAVQYLRGSFSVEIPSTTINITTQDNYPCVNYTTPTFSTQETRLLSQWRLGMSINIGAYFLYNDHHHFSIHYYLRELGSKSLNLANGSSVYNPYNNSHHFIFSYYYMF